MMKCVAYGGWNRCARLENGSIEIIVPLEIGPRVIRLGYRGERNLFHEEAGHLGKAGGSEWRSYGGHRLWHAPESLSRTYFPDNEPIAAEGDSNTLRVVQPVESTTGIQKELDIELHAGEDIVTVTHRLRNTNLWDIELAVWGLSVMAPGGRVLIPQEPYAPHPEGLLPARPLVLWPYTNMADPRFSWGRHFIEMRQDVNATGPLKIGVRNTLGYGVYTLGEFVFMKAVPFIPAVYPDFDSNMEFFTDKDMLEVESLSPMVTLEASGGTTEHTEYWVLSRRPLPADEIGKVEVFAEMRARVPSLL